MILPNNVLYLVHATNHNPADIRYMNTWPKCNESISSLQYPGVYFSLITKENRLTQDIYPGKYVLIFSAKLLLQSNWHINAKDHNGNVTEHNTFFPWNFDTAIDKLSDKNEVVFHDPIDMKHLCKVLIRPSHREDEEAYMRYIANGGIQSMLPTERFQTNIEPDLTKQPFYVFNTENQYTGSTNIPKSSVAWFHMMAKVAKLSPIPQTESELVNVLQKQSVILCANRMAQDLEPLKEWTRTHC